MIARALTRLAAAQAFAAGAILAAVAFAATLNALLSIADRAARLWGGAVPGLSGIEDGVRLAAAAALPLCLPWCQAVGGHVVAALLSERFAPALVDALDRLWRCVIAALAAFLAIYAARGLIETRADGVVAPVLGWSEWPFYTPAIVALATWGALAAIQAVGSNVDA